MKRRSATSSGRQRNRVILFVDRSLGRRSVVDALRDAGANVEAHDDHFEQDTPDTEWIPEVAKRGWFILTKDKAIRRRYLELQAVRDSEAGLFALTAGGLRGLEMAALFVKFRERIENLATSRRKPFWATVTKVGVEVQKLKGLRRHKE